MYAISIAGQYHDQFNISYGLITTPDENKLSLSIYIKAYMHYLVLSQAITTMWQLPNFLKNIIFNIGDFTEFHFGSSASP